MLPRHVAIIMDGNGRWAGARRLPRAAGHRAGMETLREVVRHAAHKGIEWLTLYAFSSENWLRPAEEVGSLLSLLKIFIRRDLQALRRDKVRIRIIGDRSDLSAEILALLHEAEEETRHNTGLNLIVAFNYGSRNELARVAQKLAAQAAAGALAPKDIDEKLFAEYLDTASQPDPDLIIRTGGEIRLSNFLLWQAAYAELSFVPCYWPAFTIADFDAALAAYGKRERRFGRLLPLREEGGEQKGAEISDNASKAAILDKSAPRRRTESKA